MCISRPRQAQRGLTMIELVIFIVIISIAVVGILQTMNVANRASTDPLRRKQALLLAEGLLEEVQLAAFTYCDMTDINVETTMPGGTCAVYENVGQSGGTRPYNNVNDYVTAYNTDQSTFNSGGVLVDAAGNVLAGDATHLPGYTATIRIAPDALNDITSAAGNAANNVLHITIRVSYGSGTDDNIVLDGYRTRYAPTAPAQ